MLYIYITPSAVLHWRDHVTLSAVLHWMDDFILTTCVSLLKAVSIMEEVSPSWFRVSFLFLRCLMKFHVLNKMVSIQPNQSASIQKWHGIWFIEVTLVLYIRVSTCYNKKVFNIMVLYIVFIHVTQLSMLLLMSLLLLMFLFFCHASFNMLIILMKIG